MNDAQYALNPVVTLDHKYHLPPVGKSLWRKAVKRDAPGTMGVKAKTHYPVRPDSWDPARPWPSDQAFGLVQGGLLPGKSVGFLPLKVHAPTLQECKQKGWDPPAVSQVIDEWLLLEYACVFLPANQETLVEAVSKGALAADDALLDLLGLDRSLFAAPPPRGNPPPGSPPAVIPFTPLEEIGKAVQRYIDAVKWEEIARKALEDGIARRQGRV